jgi:hypothetical protein
MDHSATTEEIKLAAKKRRRLAAKSEIKIGIGEYEEDEAPESG